MALSKKEKLHILEILKSEGPGGTDKSGVDLKRLLKGTIRNVSGPRGSWTENDYDKIEGKQEDIFSFWQWLQNKGFIVPIDTINMDRFRLTSTGEEYHEKIKTSSAEPLDIDLDSVIFNEQLLVKVAPAFESGNYDTAIRDACVLLEEAIRNKAMLGEIDHGQDLVVQALHHDNGVLTFPVCKKSAESEGVFFLFKGVLGFARNISMHHTKRLSSQATALQIVVFIDFLLRLLDTAQIRP